MDISNAGEPVILPTARILPEARAPLADAVGPSNRVNAVGQLAKTAVQDAREAGLELPKNAQGYAASQIASGADPESVFSALVAETATADGNGTGAAADATRGTDEPNAPAEKTGAAEVINLIPDDAEGPRPEEIALDLLTEDEVA